MSKQIAKQPTEMVREIFQDMSAEERLESLRNSADQVVNHSYTKPYTEEEISEIRKNIAEKCVEISDLERELAAIKADYKARITPMENDREQLIGELRCGGDFVTEECFVYVHYNIGKAGLYTKDGILLKEMDITKDMEQSTIFQALREDPDEQDQCDDDTANEEERLLLDNGQ